MTEDQFAYLQLAFRNLRVFSVPGIGSFSKKLRGAHVDTDKNIIHPPTEYFDFVPGGATYAAEFMALLVEKQNMTEEAAEEMVNTLGQNLLEALKKKRQISIPKVGALKLTEKETIVFELTDQDPTLQTYGLNPVHYGGRTEEMLEEEIPRRKKAEGKKKSAALLVILLLLLGSVVAGTILFWDDISQELGLADKAVATAESGKRADKAKSHKDKSPQKKKPKAETKEKPSAKSTEKKSATPPKTAETAPDPAPKPAPKKETQPAAPAPATTPAKPAPQPTVAAPAKTYRLILAETFDKGKVQQELAFWQDYGGKVVALGPNTYTIEFYRGPRAQGLARQRKLVSDGVLYHASQTKLVE